MGHSLGGLVATLTVARSPAQWQNGGLILLAPALDVERNLSMRIQEPIAGCLNIILPRARIVAAVRDEDMCKILVNPAAPSSSLLASRTRPAFRRVACFDSQPCRPRSLPQDVVKKWKANALNQPGNLPVRISFSALQGFKEVQRLPPLNVPLLVIHGLADKCTSPKAAEAFVAKAAAPDKAFVGLPGVKHMLLHEPEKEQVFAALADWIARRSAPGQRSYL